MKARTLPRRLLSLTLDLGWAGLLGWNAGAVVLCAMERGGLTLSLGALIVRLTREIDPDNQRQLKAWDRAYRAIVDAGRRLDG